MKKIILSTLLILGIGFATQAQTIGLLAQPNLNNGLIRKGIYAEYTIYKKIGLYTDYKFSKTNQSDNTIWYTYHIKTTTNQLNIGASYKLSNNIKVFATSSIVNSIKHDAVFIDLNDTEYTGQDKYKNLQNYQVGATYNINKIVLLVAYEDNKYFKDNRISLGLGLKIK